MPLMRIVDLSFPLRSHFRWTVASERRSTHESGALFQSTVSTSSDRDIAQMPVDQWMGPAAVVDLTHLGENGAVTAADLELPAGHVDPPVRGFRPARPGLAST
jgi:hypothetical protein